MNFLQFANPFLTQLYMQVIKVLFYIYVGSKLLLVLSGLSAQTTKLLSLWLSFSMLLVQLSTFFTLFIQKWLKFIKHFPASFWKTCKKWKLLEMKNNGNDFSLFCVCSINIWYKIQNDLYSLIFKIILQVFTLLTAWGKRFKRFFFTNEYIFS